MNEEITKYINEASAEQNKIMEAIRAIIHNEIPAVKENLKWGRPVFSTETDFAYFKTSKNHLTFGIFKFDKIHDNKHFLEGTGKDMRHIKIKKLDDLQPEIIISWLKQITK